MRALFGTAFALGLSAMLGCGDGTLIYGGVFDDPPASVVVKGDVKEQTPSNAARDVVVFVFTDLTSAALAAGPPYEKYPRAPGGSLDTTAPAHFTDQESRLLDDADTFSIPDVESGDITVMFLLDDPEPDGQIDLGDFYAVFVDSERKLRGIKGGRTANIPEIEILYDTDLDGGVASTDEDITTVIERDSSDN